LIQQLQTLDNCMHIVVICPIKEEDISFLEDIFLKNYSSWIIEFGKIYTVDKKIIDILYGEIFQNKKNISLVTHTSTLNSYFRGLGFVTKFESLIEDNTLELSSIEVVLIGGSAGSTQKILEMTKSIHLQNITIIIVQHVGEEQLGIFDRILQNNTNSRVKYASDGEVLQKATIYIAPNNYHLKITNNCFELNSGQKYNFSKPSISLSYESFSDYYKEKLLIIHECGFGSDGVDKLKYIKANKTKLIIQKEEECDAKPMVSHALELNVHDGVLGVKDLTYCLGFLDTPFRKEEYIDYFLDMVYKVRAYNFKSYNKQMMQRRINVFMIKYRIKNMKDALGLILFNDSSFKGFILKVSINVTEFFREAHSLLSLSEIINDTYKHAHHIKIWSAGCSSGEETYSVAIILENLKLLDKSLIYATDFNDVALAQAKNALFPLKDLQNAQNNYNKLGFFNTLNDYFTMNNNYVKVDEKIKKKILFFQHNLVQDSSFNEFDIIICKNVIIYFDSELQNFVFELFYNSLKYGGYLVLGKSELVSSKYRDKFQSYGNNSKIYRKIA
jgi:chemotaxis protein methyltransferase CheR